MTALLAAPPLTSTRLLPADGQPQGHREHLRQHGALPYPPARTLLDEIERSGLVGRGGAGFPVHRKLRAVAAGRRPVVVANGAEGEPSSSKDRMLLTLAPHLVLDGLQAAAQAVGASRAVIYVHRGPAVEAVRRALAERRDPVRAELVEADDAFVSGQETAVVRAVDGGPGLPRSASPRVFEKGVGGRPTAVQNAETLAHVALITRWGADWFRKLGTAREPGTMLCTLSGVGPVVVLEAALGTPLREVLRDGGCEPDDVRALLIGGYHGAWLTGEEARTMALSAASLTPTGATPGAGVLFALGAGECPLAMSAEVTRYLADSSARQCGPCLNGLPAMASTMAALARRGWSSDVRARLEQLARLVDGRGACAHPDGTARFVRSVLATFPDELAAHAAGSCLASRRR